MSFFFFTPSLYLWLFCFHDFTFDHVSLLGSFFPFDLSKWNSTHDPSLSSPERRALPDSASPVLLFWLFFFFGSFPFVTVCVLDMPPVKFKLAYGYWPYLIIPIIVLYSEHIRTFNECISGTDLGTDDIVVKEILQCRGWHIY